MIFIGQLETRFSEHLLLELKNDKFENSGQISPVQNVSHVFNC